jgi:hemolysin activation/secretion protein
MKKILFLSLFLLSSTYVFAQNSNAVQQADQIQRLKSDQLRTEQELSVIKTSRAPNSVLPVAPVAKNSTLDQTCINVQTIAVDGVSVMSPSHINTITALWKGKCLGLSELNSLLESLTYLYVKRGYVASRAYLPEQNLKDGSLNISVIEGTLQSVRLNGHETIDGRIRAAFPLKTGKPVNLRDVEQGVDHVNRLRSSKATLKLEPGKQAGDSVLDIKIDESRPWFASTSFDTLGGVATGIHQSKLDVGYENLFGVNDEWQLGYQRSMNQNPLYFNSDRPNSNSVTASASVPYGYFTFGANVSWSDYHSTVNGSVSVMNSSGGSLSIAPYVLAVLHRDQTSKTWITGRLTWKENENFLLGSKIDVSSRTLAILAAELGHSHQLFGGQLSANLGYHRGIDAFGALNDTGAPEGMPKAQFQKFTGSLAYTRAQELGAVSVITSNSISGQWADDRLFGSEQMSLGGHLSVRGAREAVLYADKALLMRNELSVLLPEMSDANKTKTFGRFEPYIALDLGRSFVGNHENGITGNLVGGAIGLRNRGGKVNFDISYSDIMSKPDVIGEFGLVLARLSVEF